MKALVWFGLLCSTSLIAPGADEKPTVAEAKAFLEAAESKLLVLSVESSRADWVKNTYITDDTETLAAKADERAIAKPTHRPPPLTQARPIASAHAIHAYSSTMSQLANASRATLRGP